MRIGANLVNGILSVGLWVFESLFMVTNITSSSYPSLLMIRPSNKLERGGGWGARKGSDTLSSLLRH